MLCGAEEAPEAVGVFGCDREDQELLWKTREGVQNVPGTGRPEHLLTFALCLA